MYKLFHPFAGLLSKPIGVCSKTVSAVLIEQISVGYGVAGKRRVQQLRIAVIHNIVVAAVYKKERRVVCRNVPLH